MNIHHIITWDWRQQPDVEELNNALEDIISNGYPPTVYTADTASDEYAWVVSSNCGLIPKEVQEIFNNWEREQTED